MSAVRDLRWHTTIHTATDPLPSHTQHIQHELTTSTSHTGKQAFSHAHAVDDARCSCADVNEGCECECHLTHCRVTVGKSAIDIIHKLYIFVQ